MTNINDKSIGCTKQPEILGKKEYPKRSVGRYTTRHVRSTMLLKKRALQHNRRVAISHFSFGQSFDPKGLPYNTEESTPR